MRVPRSVRVNWSFCSWVSMVRSSSRRRESVGGGARGANDRAPALQLGRYERGELPRVEVAGLDALGTQPLAHLGGLQRPPHLGTEPAHDLRRAARGARERK